MLLAADQRHPDLSYPHTSHLDLGCLDLSQSDLNDLLPSPPDDIHVDPLTKTSAIISPFPFCYLTGCLSLYPGTRLLTQVPVV